jgi:hypothetical protein
MSDLLVALDLLLAETQGEPSDALERLTVAAARLSSRWSEYQKTIDPDGWQETKARLADLDSTDDQPRQPKASSF